MTLAWPSLDHQLARHLQDTGLGTMKSRRVVLAWPSLGHGSGQASGAHCAANGGTRWDSPDVVQYGPSIWQ